MNEEVCSILISMPVLLIATMPVSCKVVAHLKTNSRHSQDLAQARSPRDVGSPCRTADRVLRSKKVIQTM